MKTSEQINEIGAALLAAQPNIGHAVKDKENPYYGSKYADLAMVKNVCMPALTEAGIAVIQAPATNDDGSVTIKTRFLHASSAQWIESEMSGKAVPDKRGNITVQALASVVTMLRRYTLQTMANVAAEDDDGEGASGRSPSDGDKVTPTGKPKTQPDRIDIDAADYVVPDEFWERPHLGLAKEPGWKVNDWLAHFGAYINQAPEDVTLDRFWRDNLQNIEKLSDVRQYWCREVWTARMSEILPPDMLEGEDK